MTSLTTFFDAPFNTQQEDWESVLRAELKLPDISGKILKKTISGLTWPTLSLGRRGETSLSPETTWKKASTTYVALSRSDATYAIRDDLKGGVRNFFFHRGALDTQTWSIVESVLQEHSALDELEVFFLGSKGFRSTSIRVISDILSGTEAHDAGGHSIQELAVLAKKLTEAQDRDTYIGVFVDSHFFHNIAKLRAARLLAKKIFQENGYTSSIKLVALTSYQGWTIFERYSNMLRNETAVASAYIGGADHVQSAGYNSLLELEARNLVTDDHVERSRRMGRNTGHILALESMLGVVDDAAYGSYHLENLTQALCQEAWSLMQRLLGGADLTPELARVREERLRLVQHRRLVFSGINDYPDVKEELRVELKSPTVFRVARCFEELRLRMEKLPRPQVYVALFGDYGALNARLNFVKNYFELLGLQVREPGHSVNDLTAFSADLRSRGEEIVVLCAADDRYPLLAQSAQESQTAHKFLAGKAELPGHKNLFAGQNVYEVLEEIVLAFERRHA